MKDKGEQRQQQQHSTVCLSFCRSRRYSLRLYLSCLFLYEAKYIHLVLNFPIFPPFFSCVSMFFLLVYVRSLSMP